MVRGRAIRGGWGLIVWKRTSGCTVFYQFDSDGKEIPVWRGWERWKWVGEEVESGKRSIKCGKDRSRENWMRDFGLSRDFCGKLES